MKIILPYLVALSALALASCAAYYSIFGLSKFYAGAAEAVIIMGISIEVAKLVATSVLHQYSKVLRWPIKIYLTLAIVFSMAITSAGIYGFLVSAFQTTSNELVIMEKQSNVIEMKKERFQGQFDDYKIEKESLNKNITELATGLSNNVIQYKDRETGQIITTTSSSTRKVLQGQLDDFKLQRDKVSGRMESLADSITKLDIQILNVQTNNDLASEIGPLKYIAEITGKSINEVVNYFTLILILIFDPLAVALVIVLNNITKRNPKIGPVVANRDQLGDQPEESKAERVKAPTPDAPNPNEVKMSKPPGLEFDTPYTIEEITEAFATQDEKEDIYKEDKPVKNPEQPRPGAYRS